MTPTTMTPAEEEAVELMLAEADRLLGEDRYAQSQRAAERAVRAADMLGPAGLGLWVRALSLEAAALRMQGQYADALARYGEILAVAHGPSRAPGEDPTVRARALGAEPVLEAVAWAYMNSVESARFLPGMDLGGLLAVVEDGLAWLRAVGRWHWRAGMLLERAQVLHGLGRASEAIPVAEEALDMAEREPGAPGYTLATHRWSLGYLLRQAGRARDAEPHYQRALHDPASSAHDRKASLEGLARCALATDQPAAARGHAERAVAEAELLGDNALCVALSVLVAAARAQADLAAAEHAAQRHLEAARRTRSPYGLYYALRDAMDVALDRGPSHGDQVRAHLAEIAPITRARDRSRGDTTFSDQIAEYQRRLDALGSAAAAVDTDTEEPR